jgi:hypothetical protein
MARAWAKRRNLRVIAVGHAVACKHTGNIMFVDFVFECARTKQSYLACIYEEGKRRRGGPLLKYAIGYMQGVQKICNRDMNFYPRVLAMCVYGRGTIYARDVGLY